MWDHIHVFRHLFQATMELITSGNAPDCPKLNIPGLIDLQKAREARVPRVKHRSTIRINGKPEFTLSTMLDSTPSKCRLRSGNSKFIPRAVPNLVLRYSDSCITKDCIYSTQDKTFESVKRIPGLTRSINYMLSIPLYIANWHRPARIGCREVIQ